MQDVIDQIFVYLKGIWLKRIFIVLAIWAICPLGWYAVWKMPDQYASKAQVYVDTQSLLRPLLRGLTVQPNTDYQTLVTVMDTVRIYPAVVAASLVDAVLFPDISLGEAEAQEVAP